MVRQVQFAVVELSRDYVFNSATGGHCGNQSTHHLPGQGSIAIGHPDDIGLFHNQAVCENCIGFLSKDTEARHSPLNRLGNRYGIGV